MLAAIESGYIQRQIEESAYEQQRQIESQEQIVVGVNDFRLEGEKLRFRLLSIPPSVEEKQREKLRRRKLRRQEKLVRASLEKLKEVARSEENVMPAIIEAVRAQATLGEIADVFREIFGVYRENVLFR